MKIFLSVFIITISVNAIELIPSKEFITIKNKDGSSTWYHMNHHASVLAKKIIEVEQSCDSKINQLRKEVDKLKNENRN